MDIICDTNIWYKIANRTVTTNNYRLIANYNNIYELSKTKNLIDNPERTKKAIQTMLRCSNKHAIYEPPWIHLKKLEDSNFIYNIEKIDHYLLFTQRIANGMKIENSKHKDFRKNYYRIEAFFRKICSGINQTAQEIKQSITDKEAHNAIDPIPSIRRLISYYTSIANRSEFGSNFEWKKIELFENTIKVFFNGLETGAETITTNDIFDLLLLIYVQPGKKVWTEEKKWISMIHKAGMEKYLYQPN